VAQNARRLLGVALVAAPLIVAGCRHRDDARKKEELADARAVHQDSIAPLGPGDIRIFDADTSIELALIGQNVVGGLSQKTLNKVKRDMAKDSSDKGSGFGASIANIVKTSVSSALGTRITYPVADIQDVRVEDGKLNFYWKDGKRMHLFDNTKVNDKPVRESFSTADAEAFAAAFRARKGGEK
jgi:hypothetical protein